MKVICKIIECVFEYVIKNTEKTHSTAEESGDPKVALAPAGLALAAGAVVRAGPRLRFGTAPEDVVEVLGAGETGGPVFCVVEFVVSFFKFFKTILGRTHAHSFNLSRVRKEFWRKF